MLARILPTINIYCTMAICTIRSLEDTWIAARTTLSVGHITGTWTDWAIRRAPCHMAHGRRNLIRVGVDTPQSAAQGPTEVYIRC